MNFTVDTFLKPLTPQDTNLRVYLPNGTIFNTISPISVTRTYVSGNLLKVNLNKTQILSLSFPNSVDSQQALILFQEQIDILKRRTPAIVDPKIEKTVLALREVSDRIIATGPSNVISVTSSITSDKIQTVSVNGVVILDWTLANNAVTINSLPYTLDSEDYIIIEYIRSQGATAS